PAAGLIATYCKPMAFSTSAMKSEPGRVMNVSLGSLPDAAGLSAGFLSTAASVACASCVAAAIAVPATAAVPLRNERRPGLLLSVVSVMVLSLGRGAGLRI